MRDTVKIAQATNVVIMAVPSEVMALRTMMLSLVVPSEVMALRTVMLLLRMSALNRATVVVKCAIRKKMMWCSQKEKCAVVSS